MDALDEPLLVDDEDDDLEGYTLEEFEYGSLCCVAVMKPVVLTMVRRPQRFSCFFKLRIPWVADSDVPRRELHRGPTAAPG